jgi:hypothetical protein
MTFMSSSLFQKSSWLIRDVNIHWMDIVHTVMYGTDISVYATVCSYVLHAYMRTGCIYAVPCPSNAEIMYKSKVNAKS